MECLTIPEGGSLVRVFHAVPNAPAVDVYVNDNLAFRNVTFRQFTNYVPLTAGQYTVSLYAASTTGPALLSADLTVPEGGIYTTIATGNIDDLQLLVLDDSAPNGTSATESKIRMVQLSPNAPSLDIQVDGSTFINDITFREMTTFAAVPPNSYVVTVINATNQRPLITFRVQLKENQISTVYIIGDMPQLSAVQSVDGSSYLCNK